MLNSVPHQAHQLPVRVRLSGLANLLSVVPRCPRLPAECWKPKKKSRMPVRGSFDSFLSRKEYLEPAGFFSKGVSQRNGGWADQSMSVSFLMCMQTVNMHKVFDSHIAWIFRALESSSSLWIAATSLVFVRVLVHRNKDSWPSISFSCVEAFCGRI